MKIKWNCRECGKEEEASVSLPDLEPYKVKGKGWLISALIVYIKDKVHTSCKGDIGVKAL